MSSALQIDNLTKVFPPVTALDNIALSIDSGEIINISGPNGSGKTTFLKCMAGLITPTYGTVKIFGEDLHTRAYRFKKLIGMSTDQERSFYWRLSGRNNLKFFAGLFGIDSYQINKKIDSLAEVFGVTSWLDLSFSRYSTGIRQRFSLIRALVHEPKVLLLDEPYKSLDEEARNNLQGLLCELSKEKDVVTIITSPENDQAKMESVKEISINKGKIIS